MSSAFTIVSKTNLDLLTGKLVQVYALCSSNHFPVTPTYSFLYEFYRGEWTPDEQKLKDFIAESDAKTERAKVAAEYAERNANLNKAYRMSQSSPRFASKVRQHGYETALDRAAERGE